MSAYVYHQYGYRCEVTSGAIELRAWRPFGRSQRASIPLADVRQVYVKWTGLVSVVTRAGLEYRLGSGSDARGLPQAIQSAAAASGSNVEVVIGVDPRKPGTV